MSTFSSKRGSERNSRIAPHTQLGVNSIATTNGTFTLCVWISIFSYYGRFIRNIRARTLNQLTGCAHCIFWLIVFDGFSVVAVHRLRCSSLSTTVAKYATKILIEHERIVLFFFCLFYIVHILYGFNWSSANSQAERKRRRKEEEKKEK